jgi:hypothetical protein
VDKYRRRDSRPNRVLQQTLVVLGDAVKDGPGDRASNAFKAAEEELARFCQEHSLQVKHAVISCSSSL